MKKQLPVKPVLVPPNTFSLELWTLSLCIMPQSHCPESIPERA